MIADIKKVSVDNLVAQLIVKREKVDHEWNPDLKSFYYITGSIEGNEFYITLAKDRWEQNENSNAD